MKPPTEPPSEVTTRERVLSVVVEHGPVTSGQVARVLGLTAAAVRRHLDAMALEGLVVAQDGRRTDPGTRGPGRPAKEFVSTPRVSEVSRGGRDGHGDLAVDLLEHLDRTAGREGVRRYAHHRATELRGRYQQEVEAAGDAVPARAEALARALGRDGFAASSRPVGTGTAVAAVQLCQGRCPVHQAAAAFPEICDAETEAFADLLGVDVRRLATLGGGDRVCTTHVPLGPVDRGPRQHTAPSRPGPAAAGRTTGPPTTRTTGVQHDDGPTRHRTTTTSSPEGHPR